MKKKNTPRGNAKIKIQYPEQWIEPDKIIEMANKIDGLIMRIVILWWHKKFRFQERLFGETSQTWRLLCRWNFQSMFESALYSKWRPGVPKCKTN